MRGLPLGIRSATFPTEDPGAFQCLLLRAFELPRPWREVFLLKETQGYTITEIAAIPGITVNTALVRLERARREISSWKKSGHAERGK